VILFLSRFTQDAIGSRQTLVPCPFAIKTQLLFIALIEKLSVWLLLITVCERVTAVPEHRESSELLKIKPVLYLEIGCSLSSGVQFVSTRIDING
jgi:hypothetical protein